MKSIKNDGIVAGSEANGHSHNGVGQFVGPSTDSRSQMPSDPRGRVHGQPGYNPFDNPAAEAKRQQKMKVEAVTEDRKNRWKPHWFALDSLAELSHPWASKLVWKFERHDAFRDPVTDPPTVMFCGVDAVEAGAGDEHLEALHKLKPDEMAALKIRAAAIRQDRRKQVDSMARAIAVEREGGNTELPPVTSLRDLLAEKDDDDEFRIANVWPGGGAKVLCVAQAGGGKTTLSGNLMRSLADGDSFLDVFQVSQRAERIVIIDNEMTKGMLRGWLRRQGVRNVGAVADVVTLRGQAGLFDMGNDRLRSLWTRRLADLGCDFVVFDCLKPVLEAMGLDENRETGRFLYPFTEMLAEAGVNDVLVHHHMGHANERARGDSSMLGWSDANWKIVVQANEVTGDKLRYFCTDKVRGAEREVKEGLLTYAHSTGHLTYAGGDRVAAKKEATVDQRIERILEVLADSHADGTEVMNKSAIRKAVGGKTEITDDALGKLMQEKANPRVVCRHEGRSQLYQLTPYGMDPMNVADTKRPALFGRAESGDGVKEPRS
ncbi:AAA family ATPase [Mycobacteroides chelonae]|uniref:Uncharacterized protein n=1 Tax=Mycobacteroides chelonae TaxID=1774 RepID=A0A1S1M6C0_MYCCH|nr:AAA family ATPase [Mycobacteroides chelonae]OHU77465.1 hypothetical protein BKG84_02705 [Mycobacteroides chelonae]QQG87384.1 AAA family ATPase [Mycobacteroides chelonae]QQG92200.1 AAA family ATPase [Mycobacteroides chelonae]